MSAQSHNNKLHVFFSLILEQSLAHVQLAVVPIAIPVVGLQAPLASICSSPEPGEHGLVDRHSLCCGLAIYIQYVKVGQFEVVDGFATKKFAMAGGEKNLLTLS